MKPVAIGLDKLQANTFLGYVLPLLFVIKRKLKTSMDEKNEFVRKLAAGLYCYFDKRFNKFLQLHTSDKCVNYSIVATFSLPKFKMQWLDNDEQIELVKKTVLRVVPEIFQTNNDAGSSTPSSCATSVVDDDMDFFEFSANKNINKKIQTELYTLNRTSVEAQVMSYASSKSTNFDLLKEYPVLFNNYLKNLIVFYLVPHL